LEETRLLALACEEAYGGGRLEVQAAQDRRLQRQRQIGACRLELSAAEHQLAMAEERARSQAALAAATEAEQAELRTRSEAAEAVRTQLERESVAAATELEAVPQPPPEPLAGDATVAKEARRLAEIATREAAAAHSSLDSIRTRRQFLEETAARLNSQVKPAEDSLDGALLDARSAAEASASAREAASELAGLRAELSGSRLPPARPRRRNEARW